MDEAGPAERAAAVRSGEPSAAVKYHGCFPERRLKAKGVSDVAPKDLRRLTASAQASLVNREGKGLVRAVARA